MNKGLCLSLLMGVFIALMPAALMAWNFDYQIFSHPGGIVGNSSAVYDGILTSGGQGTLTITLDDTGWPDPSDPMARFDYIWETYFAANHDTSGGHGSWRWIGQIPGRFYISCTNAQAGYNGTCEGSINAKITVRDFNEDFILNDWELYDKQHLFDGRLAKLCDDMSSGEMALTRGFGSINSNYFSFFPPDPPGIDTLYNGGLLVLIADCDAGVQPSSWGAIKSLYE